MPGDKLPTWAIRLLVWGSSVLGSSLVAVLIWVATGISHLAEATEAKASANEKRIDRLETSLPYQFQLVNEKLDALLKKQSP